MFLKNLVAFKHRGSCLLTAAVSSEQQLSVLSISCQLWAAAISSEQQLSALSSCLSLSAAVNTGSWQLLGDAHAVEQGVEFLVQTPPEHRVQPFTLCSFSTTSCQTKYYKLIKIDNWYVTDQRSFDWHPHYISSFDCYFVWFSLGGNFCIKLGSEKSFWIGRKKFGFLGSRSITYVEVPVTNGILFTYISCNCLEMRSSWIHDLQARMYCIYSPTLLLSVPPQKKKLDGAWCGGGNGFACVSSVMAGPDTR